MKKGDLVILNVHTCFTKASGGSLEWPHSTPDRDDRRVVLGRRPITRNEKQDWYDSEHSKGLDDAGETKLPPQTTSIELSHDDILIVIRARCAPTLGYYRCPGQALVMNTRLGEECYIGRELLTVVS